MRKLFPSVNVLIGSALVSSPVKILSSIRKPALNTNGRMSFHLKIFVYPCS